MALETLKQSEIAKKKSLSEWRASRLHETELPSGLGVTLRDVSMTDLLLTGKLPASFVDLAEASASSGNTIDLKEVIKSGEDFRTMLDALVPLALVEPKIGAVADNDHITLEELPNDDKMFIFNFVNREVEQIKSFREGSDEPVAVV